MNNTMSTLYGAIDHLVDVAGCAEHGFHRHTAWTDDGKENLGHLVKNWIVGPSLSPDIDSGQRKL